MSRAEPIFEKVGIKEGDVSYIAMKMKTAYTVTKKHATGTAKQREQEAWTAAMLTVVTIAKGEFDPLNPPHSGYGSNPIWPAKKG